jgi:cell division protein ZapA
MAQVEITINGRDYRVACEDGQESHLANLAGYIDGKIGELVSQVGQIGDTRLMVMASLLVADELADMRGELAEARQSADEATVAKHLDALAARIEALAASLEAAD